MSDVMASGPVLAQAGWRGERARLAAALAIWSTGLFVATSLDDPRLRFAPFLAGCALATLGWLWLERIIRRRVPSRGECAAALALAIAARAALVLLPPAFSEDVFRYVYEGRVVWQLGPSFPFVHAPATAAEHGVPAALLDAAWLRINHPEIPTIYPPFAQLVFAAAGGLGELLGGGHLIALKTLLVAAELGAAALVARATGSRGAALVVLFSPLATLEVAREGHADSLSTLALALGIAGFRALRPRVGYAGFALAALAKLNGVVALIAAARSTRRGAGVGLALLTLVALPFLVAGPPALTGLFRYASAWRAGDGAFSLLLAAARAIVGGGWVRLGPLTVTDHQVARAFALGAFVAFAAWILRRRAEPREIPERAGLLLLGLLLLSPTLHPWYALWVLPFAVLGGAGSRAMIALVALVPILHHAAFAELESGRWTDLARVRALVHVPVWSLLIRDLVRPPALGYARVGNLGRTAAESAAEEE